MRTDYGSFALCTRDVVLLDHVAEEIARAEAIVHTSIHRETVYYGEREILVEDRRAAKASTPRLPGADIVTVTYLRDAAHEAIVITEHSPVKITEVPVVKPRWYFRPCPMLLADVAAEIKAETDARNAKIAAARTNFEALLAAGVICTADDEMDRAHAWDYTRGLAEATGRPIQAIERELNAESRERNLLRILGAAVDANETTAEHRADLEAVYSAAPRGTNPKTGKGCTHRGKGGWRFRSWGGGGPNGMGCEVCGTTVTVGARPTEPTEGSKLRPRGPSSPRTR